MTEGAGSRRRRALLASALVAVLVAAAAIFAVVRGGGDDVPSEAVPSREVTTGATGSQSPEASASTSTSTSTAPAPRRNGMTVAVPAVDLRARVLPIEPEGGVLNPPTLDKAYLIEDYGQPGSDNTVYIAGHSWDTGKAVFNPLFDRRSQTTEVRPGDEVIVTTPDATYTYVVDRTKRYRRASLPRADEVWEIVKDRLVLITCFQPDDGGEARDNLVVYATLRSTAA